jgi:hypothetical protein
MSDENKNDLEDKATETKPKVELIDSSLTKALIIVACIIFISITIFSLFFGNTFAVFITSLLSTVSFLFISRWDRLRESKDVSFQSFKDLIQLPKISIKILLLSVIIIFFAQAISGFITAQFTNCDCPINYSSLLQQIENDSFLFVSALLGIYISYPFGGFFSAKLAIRKNLSPYLHALLGSACFFVLSMAFTLLIVFFETDELVSPYNEDASVGANVLFFSQFFLLPFIGAKVAVFISKPKIIEAAKKIEEEKKAKEEFANLVASEIEKLKPKTNPKQKKKSVQAKTKKKTNS